jgi:hypothetical protein
VELVREYPEERTRLATIGATILFTGLFAGAASSYAIQTVFGDGWWVPVLAVLWGAAIFNIDRLIVMTMYGSFARKLLAAIPRLVLATVISIMITRPFELLICAPEIERRVKVTEGKSRDGVMAEWSAHVEAAQQRYRTAVAAAGAAAGVGTSKAALDEASAKVTACPKDLAPLLEAYNVELNGTGGSKRYGDGPVAKAMAVRIRAAEQQCTDLTAAAGVAQKTFDAALQRQSDTAKFHVETRDKAITDATKARDQKLWDLGSTRIDSLLGRNQQLAGLAAEDVSVFRLNLFLMLLFWFIEALPVLAKLMAGDSIYDAVVQERREAVRATRRGATAAWAAHEDAGRAEAEAAANARKRAVELHYQGVTDVLEAGRSKLQPTKEAVDDLLASIDRTVKQTITGAQPPSSELDGAPWSFARLRTRKGWRPLLEIALYAFVAIAMVALFFIAFKVISPFDRSIVNYVMTAIATISALATFKPLKRLSVRMSGSLIGEEE